MTLVVPSVWEEPFALVALEGMARGTCVVASCVGGLREVVEGNGIIVAPADPTSLADQLEWTLKNNLAARKMGEAARIAAETRFNPVKFSKEFGRIALRESRPRQPGPSSWTARISSNHS